MRELNDDPKIARQAEAVKCWFSQTGHWIYDYRAEAIRALREYGIQGRPRWNASLGAALQPWVDADPLPAIVAISNAQAGGAECARSTRPLSATR